MKLVLTRYVDSTPSSVRSGLSRNVAAALDAAADRVAVDRAETRTEAIDHGLRVTGGLDLLAGSEVRVSGTDRLTAVEVVVPWSGADAGGSKLWAANRFAASLVDEALAAA